MPFAHTGPLEALAAVFEFLIERLDDPDLAAVLRVDVELWAEAIHDPAVKEMFLDSLDYWRRRLSELVGEAQKAGELPSHVDAGGLTQLLIAMLGGLELMKVMQPEVPVNPLRESFRALLGVHADRMPHERT